MEKGKELPETEAIKEFFENLTERTKMNGKSLTNCARIYKWRWRTKQKISLESIHKMMKENGYEMKTESVWVFVGFNPVIK